MVTREQIVSWLRFTAEAIEESKEQLTELDAAIGDAEHGISMARGFHKVADQLPANVLGARTTGVGDGEELSTPTLEK